MRGIFPLLILLVWSASCSKTDTLLNPADLHKLAVLPSVLSESSGLEMTANGILWSHNDHNGKAEIYGFDAPGVLKTTVKIINSTNIDWEDIACDEAGNLYVGDFGNNDNNRRDLKIYKILPPTTELPDIEMLAEEIKFDFPEQTNFPPPEKDWFFDTEAMFAYEDWIYILTKDRSKPFVGKTRLYRLPNTPGAYQAEFLAEFLTDSDKIKGQITAADISPDGSLLALLANGRLYLFKKISGNNFFSGTLEQRDLPLSRQMEGLVFQDNCTLFLTNEAKPGEPGLLFKVNICN